MTSQPYQPTPPPLCRATHVAPLNASPTKLWTAMSVRGRHCEVSRWLFKVTPALLLVYMNDRRQECWGRRTGGCGQSHKPRSYLTTTDSRTLVPVPYVWPSVTRSPLSSQVTFHHRPQNKAFNWKHMRSVPVSFSWAPSEPPVSYGERKTPKPNSDMLL